VRNELISAYNNKGLKETAGAFCVADPPFSYDGTGLRCDGEMLPNGDIVFRYPAEPGHSISLTLGFGGESIELSDRGNGYYEGVLSYNSDRSGSIRIQFFVDGVRVLNPYLPIMSGHISENILEIPDLNHDFILLKDVPHGTVAREIFWSETIGDWARCLIYIPAEYWNTEKKYPVLYVQNGGGGNETDWMYGMNLPYMMDNILEAGECKPFLVVANDGNLRIPGDNKSDDFAGIEGILTKDCRQFIESRYRVYTDKWNRGLAGFSLGGMTTSWVGFRHPELYGYLGLFSGSIRRMDNHNTFEDSPHLEILKHPELVEKSYRLIWRSKGTLELAKRGPTGKLQSTEDTEWMAQFGTDQVACHQWHDIPNKGHNYSCWRAAFKEFAPLLFV